MQNVVGMIGYINPFRYRGYYWDNDLQLYYCESRYYDPQIGRWISPDNFSLVASLGILIINGLNLYAYCFDSPINYVDYGGVFPRKIINKNPYIRIDDKGKANEHVHVKYNGKSYSWYKIGHNTHDSKTQYGLNDLSETAQKKLTKAGLPDDYLNKMSFVQLPRWQEGFTIEQLPRWQEGFTLPQVDRNNIVTITVVAGGVLIIVCVVAAFFTGGQSLWGLLALV